MAQQAVQQHLLKAAEVIESQLDAEINKLDNMDEDEMEIIRRRRMDALKRQQEKKQEWAAVGHGVYSELPGEKEFFAESKKSENVVCHFYRESTFRCKVIDEHLKKLAAKHMETRFLKIDATKCPFLTERLKIVVLPTIALIKDGKTKDYIVGFDDMGGRDDFPTEMLEWRLGCAEVIKYNGNLSEPPINEKGQKNTKSLLGGLKGKTYTKKIIRGGDSDDSDSDLE